MADFNERHKREGIVTNQPGPGVDWDRPHASTTVCRRQGCIEGARFWVQGSTGETAVVLWDADRALTPPPTTWADEPLPLDIPGGKP